MCGAKSKSLAFAGLLLNCLGMIFSANTGFSVSVYDVTSRSISLRWPKFSGASSYRVTATAVNTVGHSLLAHFSDVTLKATLTSLIPSTVYAVQAEAIDKNGIILAEAQIMQSTVLAAPILSVSSPSCDSIALSWQAVYMAAGFSVSLMRSDGLGRMLRENTTNTSLIFTNLDPGTLYTIKAYAWNANGMPGDDFTYNQRTINISIEEDEPGHLLVSWSSVSFGHYYVVFVKSDDGLEVHCNTSHTQCRFQSDCGFTYFISVFAYNKAGQSPLGDVFNYTTAPCCPSDFRAAFVSSDTVRVTWAAVRGADLYETRAASRSTAVLCSHTAPACTLSALQCDTRYRITVRSRSEAGGANTSCAHQHVATDPCCPNDLILTQVTQSVTNVSWSAGKGAQTYVTTLESPKGQAKCHTLQNYCLLGCITCGTNYTVSLKAISETGLTSSCTYQGYSSSACCPFGVKLYRLSNNGIRVFWRASDEKINYTTDLRGSKGNFTCTPSTGGSHCDITEIPCGDVYTVVVAPLTEKGPKLTFCPKKIYSVFGIGDNPYLP
ncbi:hypothetical protein BTVI_47832 [Pitangus sulphuratus]|nr:hypothetical protein BTVI_47832 [Pitangus sulphuratus]